MTTETSIYEYARRGLNLSAEKTAIWFQGRDISYHELFTRIDCAAEQLASIGVRCGTVVTIHLPNCPQAVIAIYAVAKLGGICNMAHAQTPSLALKELLNFAESNFLFTYLPENQRLASHTVIIDIFGRATDQQISGQDQWVSMNLSTNLDHTEHKIVDIPEQSLLADECAFYLHSSGTTGTPKTIMLAHNALNHCVENTADLFELRDMADHASLGVLPLFHGFGLAMDMHRNISFGSKLVQMLRWNASEAVQLIKNHHVSSIVGVPTMYYALLNEPEFSGEKIRQLERCCVGGDDVKVDLVKTFDSRVGRNGCMLVGYGLTEATTTNLVNSYLHYKAGSCGFPMRNTTAAVINDDGVISMQGKGELIINSKTLMIGYLKEPTEDVTIYADGLRWIRTGDLVKIDDDGFVFFLSRLKNIISHNGYNVYPIQVEDVIRNVSGISDVCVVGVANQKHHTQDIRAVIIAEDPTKTNTLRNAVIQTCIERLPRYSVPQEIIFVSAFPRNAMDKIDRKKMSTPILFGDDELLSTCTNQEKTM